MTADGTGLAPGYVWDNAMVEARRRLGLLEQLYDPGTMMPALAPAGLGLRFARQLPYLLRAAGLQDVTCHLDNFLYPGGSTGARFLQVTFDQMAGKAPLSADERAVIDAANAELDDPDHWFPPVGMVAAWGRRPA